MKGKAIANQVAEYYNSPEMNEYYQHVWGGENLHVGIYQKEKDSIMAASAFTNDKMLKLIPKLKKSSKVLDIGSGYGGAARNIVKKYGSHLTCLNISKVQNEINQQKNKKEELDDDIVVMHGNMEKLPFPRESFDLVWSQDALLHSAHKENVFREVSRVLDAEGRFIFTDIFQKEEAPEELKSKILSRLFLKELGKPVKYDRLARKVDLEKVYNRDMSDMILLHYQKLKENLKKNANALAKKTSSSFVKNMEENLQDWIAALEKGYLGWGIMQYQKRNSWM